MILKKECFFKNMLKGYELFVFKSETNKIILSFLDRINTELTFCFPFIFKTWTNVSFLWTNMAFFWTELTFCFPSVDKKRGNIFVQTTIR
jgi:hypothetical protein